VGSITTCFIAAPANSNLAVLRKVLHERGIRILSPSDTAGVEGSPSGIGQVLQQADIVIGVLTRERHSDWVLFELGQAFAANRRIVLFAPPGASRLPPSDLKGMLTVRSSVTNHEAVSFAIDQLIAAPAATIRAGASAKVRTTLGDQADGFINEARNAVLAGNPRALEQAIKNALVASGVEVIASDDARDMGVDLSIWSDEFQASIGNPLLVETKFGFSKAPDVRRAAEQLATQLALSGTRFGLLLYGGGEPAALAPHALPPNVLAMSVEKLLERLRWASFAEVVNGLRNERVHGLG